MRNLIFVFGVLFLSFISFFGKANNCDKSPRQPLYHGLVQISQSNQIIDNEINYRSDDWSLNPYLCLNIVDLDFMEKLPLYKQQIVFSNITPENRYTLWVNRMSKAKQGFNQNQKNALVQIESKFSISFFSDSLSNNDELFFDNWHATVVSNLIFTDKEVFQLLTTFTPMSDPIKLIDDDWVNDDPRCICRMSEWCSYMFFGDTCGNPCVRTRLGCGWTFLRSCVGLCYWN